MAQIATTTQAEPLGVPANTRIDRHPGTGHLYAIVKSTTANTWDLYRSTNGGTSWSLHLSLLRANIVEFGSIFVAGDDHLYTSYRTNESGQDRIWFRRCRLSSPVWGPETLTGQPAHGGTPGAIHQGMDIALVDPPGRWMYVVICVGTTFGGTSGITLYGVLVDVPNGFHRLDNTFLTGRRQWMDITGTGRIVPSVDIQHNGGGKGSATPHLWIAYGRDVLRMVRLAWSGAGWSGPGTSQLLQSGLAAQDGITGRWDGDRWLMVVPHPTATDAALVVERDRSNGRSTLRQTPAHPTGVIRAVSLSYSAAGNRDMRVYAIGTSNNDLYFVDFNRQAGTWTSWSTVTTTDVLGTPPGQWSVRRGSAGNARYDVAIGHAGSPNTVTSYHQVLTYAPNTPTWDVPAIGVDNGAAAEVSSALVLDWVFSDPDPADVQSAWALSRQIGAGTVQYLRASDSTWQASEQKNAGATTARTLAASWGATSDAAHSYRVKVWDSADVASLYSDAFVVLPAGKVNPTITAPTASQVLNQDRVTVTWTVSEQTAYRVQLRILSETVFDSGWIAGTATTYTPQFPLGDLFGYAVVVQTRNLRGLASDEVQQIFSVDFVEPLTATLTATPLPGLGVIRVAITNPPTPAPMNPNPYFEADAAGWAAVGGGVARSTAQAHEGAASLLLTPSGGAATAQAQTDLLPIGAGVGVHAEAWVRCAVSRTVNIAINWNQAGGTFISQSFASFPVVAGVWTKIEVDAVSPPLTGQCRLLAASLTGTPPNTHLLHIDEATIRLATDPPAAASVDLYRRPVRNPTLFSADFESADMSSWGSSHAGTATRTNSKSHSGSWSYQLTSDGTDFLGSHVETVKIPCTPGTSYFLDMWIAGSAMKDTFAQLRFHDAGGAFIASNNGIGKPPPTANAWEYRWATGTAPANATHMTLLAVVDTVPTAGDVIWVDEVRVRVNDSTPGVRVAQGLPAGATYDDWRAVSGVDYEYRAEVRSVIGTTVGGVWTR
ncbi:carbohydrate binding domain-containing protein [Micromonospora sp. NPDC003944]